MHYLCLCEIMLCLSKEIVETIMSVPQCGDGRQLAVCQFLRSAILWIYIFQFIKERMEQTFD